MFEKGFIKNTKLLEEHSRTENLLDLTSEIERFSTKLDSIRFSSIFGFIGKFGTGKTNFLNQIKNKYTEKSKWFEFDAWKYPERGNLWESFVLEVARQIDPKTFDKIIRKLDGKNPTKWLEKFIKFFSGFIGSIKNFSDFLNTSPVKRTFEIQNMLTELFEKIKEKGIYIIVEDIDRSGDNGIYFLETLNYFLKSNEIEKIIIVIVPIGKEKYDRDEIKLSYSKCLDYEHDFSLSNIKLNKFIEAIFEDEILSKQYHKGQIISFLELIFIKYPEQITIRLLKKILRNSNQNYIVLVKKHGELVDFRLSIIFRFLKEIKIDNQNKLRNIQNGTSTSEFNGNDLFSFFIWIIIGKVNYGNLIYTNDVEHRTKEHYIFGSISIKFNENIECKFNEGEKNYNICIDYLDN